MSWPLTAALVALAVYALLVLGLVLAGRRSAARAVAGFVPDCLVLFRRLLRDAALSRRHRAAVVALVAYLASPIDVVPDFVPVAGQLDDAILVVLVLRMIVRAAGPALIVRHWPGPDASLAVLLRLAGKRPVANEV